MTWPGKGPRGAKRFIPPEKSRAFFQVLGNSLNPALMPTETPTGIPPIEAIYRLTLPQIGETIVSFGFNTSIPEGAFNFIFKWMGGVWNCWVTMPDGTVRPAGCIPQVLNWIAYRDYSLVVISSIPALGLGDLVGSTMLIVKWKI